MKNNFCQMWLTVGSKDEADKIANNLLGKHLVACVRQLPANSNFHWQGQIDQSNEILLQMESRQDLFEQVEAEVKKLHSYDTFVLTATPTTKISRDAEKWLQSELRNG